MLNMKTAVLPSAWRKLCLNTVRFILQRPDDLGLLTMVSTVEYSAHVEVLLIRGIAEHRSAQYHSRILIRVLVQFHPVNVVRQNI